MYHNSFLLSRVLRDRQARLASLLQLQPETQEELSPSLRFGDASRSALGVWCPKALSADIKWSVQRASPLGEVGGVGFVRAATAGDRREGRLSSFRVLAGQARYPTGIMSLRGWMHSL